MAKLGGILISVFAWAPPQLSLLCVHDKPKGINLTRDFGPSGLNRLIEYS